MVVTIRKKKKKKTKKKNLIPIKEEDGDEVEYPSMHQARSSRGLVSAASLKKMPRSRKVLTFEDRVKTIHLFDTGKMSLTAIAEEMDITNAQATIIIKKRKEILSSWESGSVRARQKYHIKRKNVKAWKLGLFVWQWYHEARARNICGEFDGGLAL